jgi:hypothetical protein
MKSPLLLSLLVIAGLTLAGVAGYGVGHRAGRGSACFAVAVHAADLYGQSLSSLYLS